MILGGDLRGKLSTYQVHKGKGIPVRGTSICTVYSEVKKQCSGSTSGTERESRIGGSKGGLWPDYEGLWAVKLMFLGSVRNTFNLTFQSCALEIYISSPLEVVWNERPDEIGR